MKRKLLFLMTLVITAFTYNAKAQTDVTSQHLTNADFSESTPIASNLKGYGKDGSPYGFQDVDEWSFTVVSADNSNASYLNSGMGGAVFAYGSSYQLQGNNKSAPATNPDGVATGNCLGFFAVWSCGGYYYQDVTLPAGGYTINIPVYNQSGTNGTTTYFGFYPTSGTNQTMATPTSTGSWVTLTKSFTLSSETTGQIRIGYKSNGSGSGANPHLFIDKVQILYTDPLDAFRDDLQALIDNATNYNTELESSELATAISTATGIKTSATTETELTQAKSDLNAAIIAALKTKDGAVTTTTSLFVNNNSFETGDLTGWEAYNANDTGVRANSNSTYTTSGVDGDYLFNTWGGNAAKYVKQTVSGLPEGYYTITALIASDSGNKVTLYAGNAQKEVEASSGGKGVFVEATTSMIYVAEDGSLEFGTTSTSWYKCDNFRLTYYTLQTGAQAAWQEAHNAAVDATNNGDYDNVNGKERADLNAEIAKAEPTTVEGYEEATAALIEATNTFTAAKPSYDELAAEIAYATTLEVPTTEAQTVLDSEETTATTAVTATEALKVLEYTTLKEGYTYDASAKLGDWTVTGFSSTTTGQHWNGQNTQYFDQWNGSAAEPSLIQSVTLPAGEYLFMAAGRGPSTSSLSMTVNGTTVNFKMKGDTGKGIDTNGDANFGDGTYANNNNGRGWEWRYVIFTLNEETEVSFAINGNINNSWVSVTKEMNLYSKPSAALSKEVLAAVLEQANGVKDDAANVGDAAFQIPTATYNTFVDAIASGQAVYDNSSATTEQVDDAIEDLNEAIEAFNNAELNAPASGQVFNIINVSEGFNFKNHPVSFKSASDADLTANTTAMGWAEEVASIYPQTVTFTPVEGVLNSYTLSYTRADGNTIYVGTGSSTGLGNNNDQLRPTSDATKALIVKVEVTKTDDVWKLYNTLASKYMGSNGDQGFYTSPAYSDIKIQEAAKHNVSLNILAANQYGTITLPFDVAVPDGVVAYSTTELNGSEIMLTEVFEIKANTPYILFAEAGAETTLSGYGAAYTDTSYTSGLLTGAYDDETQVPTDSYVLQNLNDYVAFYKVTAEAPITMPAYRAYLTAPEASGVKILNFGPADDATGISAIEALTTGTAEIYNAAGVRINKLEKGVNIIRTADGKTQKVLVK